MHKPIKLASIERLVDLLGGEMPEFESSGDTYHYVLADALREGKTQEEAEALALEAEAEEEREAWEKFKDAVEFIARDLFDKHDLVLDARDDDTYHVVPRTSWRVSADHIRETINGVGYFYFAGLREFLNSIPCTPREAVASHMHWVKDWPNVYEGSKAWSLVERRWR